MIDFIPLWNKIDLNLNLIFMYSQCNVALSVLKGVCQIQLFMNGYQMMTAVCVDTPGGPESMLLRNVPRPQPEHGEVLIRVHATALNRADTLQVYPYRPYEYSSMALRSTTKSLSLLPPPIEQSQDHSKHMPI